MPEKKPEKLTPDATNPAPAIEKPKKHDPPQMKKEPAPPANAQENPPPARDAGKKQKKNEPATSPSP
jgi:hypothetical protein